MNVIVVVVIVMSVIKGYIYRHWIINDKGIEKSYIGKTKKTVEHRSRNNGKGYLYHDTLFARAIKKYGWDNFHHDIIGVIECETEDELCFWLNEWEKYYIWKYDSYNNGYNSTFGGDGGITWKGQHHWKGKHHSIEQREKWSRERKGTRIGADNYNSKKVICLNTGQIFSSISEAAKWCGLASPSHIVQCCKGKREYIGKHPITKEKLRWKYFKE